MPLEGRSGDAHVEDPEAVTMFLWATCRCLLFQVRADPIAMSLLVEDSSAPLPK